MWGIPSDRLRHRRITASIDLLPGADGIAVPERIVDDRQADYVYTRDCDDDEAHGACVRA